MASRQDDALRAEAAHELVADIVRMDLAIDLGLAHPPGDELGVLRAEVQDEDPVVAFHGGLLLRCGLNGGNSAAEVISSCIRIQLRN